MNEWVIIDESVDMYIEVKNFESISLMRSYIWCSETDTCKFMETKEISTEIAMALIKSCEIG
jgi:hypothetical protein